MKENGINVRLRKLAADFARLVIERFAGNAVSIVLFGSVARGEANPSSDIDLIIIMRSLPDGRLARNRIMEPIEEKLEGEFDDLRHEGIFSELNYFLKTTAEARHVRPLFFDLTEDAVYLRDEGGFFKGIIGKLKKRMADLGSKRKKIGSVRYWEIKPGIKWEEEFTI
ncbi:MAG: nucleotidyltransferase domain-containing protein [Pseudomonadota bacterium]